MRLLVALAVGATLAALFTGSVKLGWFALGLLVLIMIIEIARLDR